MPQTSEFEADAQGTPLQITSNRDGDSVTISLLGDLDLASVRELGTAILVAEKGDATLIVVDLAEVTFIDSTGLSQLMDAKKRNNGRLRIKPSNHDAVARVLSLTRTTEIVE